MIAQGLVFWRQNSLVDDPLSSANVCSKWPTPFQTAQFRPIFAHSASTVRASEKSWISTNRKSTTCFPTSHRWTVYVTIRLQLRRKWSDLHENWGTLSILLIAAGPGKGHFAITSWITLNHLSTAAMRLMSNYFHHLLSVDAHRQSLKACVIYLTKTNIFRLPLKLWLLHGSRTKSAISSPQQISSKSVHFKRSYSRRMKAVQNVP